MSIRPPLPLQTTGCSGWRYWPGPMLAVVVAADTAAALPAGLAADITAAAAADGGAGIPAAGKRSFSVAGCGDRCNSVDPASRACGISGRQSARQSRFALLHLLNHFAVSRRRRIRAIAAVWVVLTSGTSDCRARCYCGNGWYNLGYVHLFGS